MRPVTRFFRENSRTFVLIIMSLLLVVFLIGDFFDPSRGRRTEHLDMQIGVVDGRKVTQADLRRAEVDSDVTAALFGTRIPISAKDEAEKLLTTHLLVDEARSRGLRIGSAQLETQLQQMASSGLNVNGTIAALSAKFSLSHEAILESVARVLSVLQYAQVMSESGGVFETPIPRRETAFREQRQEAQIRAAVIDANALLSKVAEPTEEEIAAHFEEAKSRVDAHTDDSLVFGYRTPEKVAVEYLTIDPATLLAKVSVRERDVEKFYNEHRDRYTKPGAPTTNPAERPQPIPLSLEEARDRVKADVREQKAAAEAQRIVNEMREFAIAPWQAMPADDKGVRAAPPADKIVDFEALRARYADRADITLHRTEALDFTGLRRDPLFGAAQVGGFGRGQRGFAAPLVAFTVEGATRLGGSDELASLHVGEPAPVAFTRRTYSRGDASPHQPVLFRVVKFEPSGPPASIDVVRPKLIENLKMMKAMALAGEAASKLRDRAKEIGLEAACSEATELKQLLADAEEAKKAQSQPADQPPIPPDYVAKFGPTLHERFRRSPGMYPHLGYSPTLADRVFKLVDETAGAGPVAHRVTVVPTPAMRTWAVIELESLKPLYEGDYAAAKQALTQTMQYEFRSFVMGWFDSENVRKRTGYVEKVSAN